MRIKIKGQMYSFKHSKAKSSSRGRGWKKKKNPEPECITCLSLSRERHTSIDLNPQVKWRCLELAALESQPLYSYKLVDV